MKTLYESILDDEDEITSSMGNVIEKNHIYNKISDCVKGTWLEGKITLINNRLNIDGRLDANIKVSADIFGNKDIEDIEYIKELSMNDFKNKDIKGSKYIRRVSKLVLDHPFIKRFKKFDKFTIGDIQYCRCQVTSTDEWTKAFIYWRPKNLKLEPSIVRGNAPIKNVKGLSVDNLILDYRMFEDYIKDGNKRIFKLTKTNAEDLDNVFTNNRFTNLYVSDYSSLHLNEYWLIEKTNKDAGSIYDYGYKKTRKSLIL